MALPVKKSQKVTALDQQTILVYGRAKVGKSTLCSQFPKPLFLATEAGLNHLEVYKYNCNNWMKFLEACGEIAKGKHDFKTIVIDTIDNLVMYCAEHVCQENGINHPSDMPMGKGWHLVTSELNVKLQKLSILPYGLVLVSHSVKEDIETKTRKYNRWTINVGGKNKHIFLNMSDLILFIDSEIGVDGEEVRVIRTKPSMNWEAGDRTGKLPEKLSLDYSELTKYIKPLKEVK